MSQSPSLGSCSPTPPPMPGAPTIRPSRASKWRTAVLISVHALVAIHVAHWATTGKTVSPFEPSEAMDFCKRGLVNAGFVFFGITIASTFVLGRFFCGWGCHVVALQDLCRWLLRRMGISPKPLRSRILAIVPMLAVLYMFFLPLADRICTTKSAGVTGMHFTTERFWGTFPEWPVAVVTFLVCGFGVVYFLGSKGFCTYGCPYGAIFGAADRLSPGRIRVTDACQGCGHCTAACTSNVRVHEEVALYKMVVDPGCMKCLDCVSVCPNDALYFGFGKPSILVRKKSAAKARRREFALWEEALLAVFFALSFVAVRGLYGQVPFLLSLGISGIFAYVSVQAIRLAYSPNVSLLRWPLKRVGRLGPGGFAFLGLMLVIVPLWAHSGLIQYHAMRRRRLADESGSIRPNWPALLLQASVKLDAAQASLVDDGVSHALFVEDWGLLHDSENDLDLGWFLFLRGDATAGESRLRRAIRDYPRNATLTYSLALYLRSKGNTDEAVAQFRQAVRVEPDFLDAHLALGQTLAMSNRFAEAAKVYDAALAIRPDLAEVHYNYGLLLAEEGNLPAAIERFRRAIALNPSLAPVHRDLGRALFAAGASADAIREYLEALRIDPRDVETHHGLAIAYAAGRNFEEAEKQLRIAMGLAPRNATLYLTMSEVCAAKGDTNGAVRNYAQAIQIDPSLQSKKPQ